MFGRSVESDRKALSHLLYLDVFRGPHSTGLATISNKNEITVLKKVGNPVMFFNEYKEEFDQKNFVYKGTDIKMFIGHNRFATKGKISDANAHPFHHNTVVGAHNGTLTSVSTLENGNKFEVDSEAIFYNLDKFDTVDTISNIHGAYALTWYDKHVDKAMFIRNNARPLFYTRRTDGDVIFWASEEWMLQVALKNAKVPHGEIKEFQVNTLYSFDLSPAKDYSDWRKRQFEIKKDVFGFVPKAQPKPTYTVYTNKNYYGNRGGGSNTPNPFPPTPQPSGVGRNISSGVFSEDFEKRFSEMRALQGKEITFCTSGMREGYKKAKYISAYPKDIRLDYDIRIFPSQGNNSKQFNEIAKKNHFVTYKATVKRAVKNYINGKTEAYLLIDNRSIVEVTPDYTQEVKDEIPFDDGELYLGYNGRYLNRKEWDKCVESGCSCCQSNADPTDEKLQFIADDQFLCGNCSIDSAYKSIVPRIH